MLALDPDVAGDRATLRSLTVARQNLERESAPIFDPRGLLRDEGHLELDIRVATMPNEMDPDELIASNPESWRSLISKAPSIVDYVMEVFTTGRDLQDSKVKAEIIDDIVDAIESLLEKVGDRCYNNGYTIKNSVEMINKSLCKLESLDSSWVYEQVEDWIH